MEMDIKELQSEFNKLDFEYKQLEERRKKLMEQLMVIGSSLDSATTIYNGTKIVSWKDGSWEDIGTMIEAHYNGDINITDYWKCGDTRRIKLNNGESIDLVLIGNNHDDLANPINGITKAVFTIQTKNCLETEMSMFIDCDEPKFSLWKDSPRRTWCNNEFKNALPAGLVSLIKKVSKVTYRYANSSYSSHYSYRGSTITEDQIFLLSVTEVYGTRGLDAFTYGSGSDGTQYEYYKTASNRIKYLGIDGTAQIWWLRSSYVYGNGYSYFRSVYSDGDVYNDYANNTYGLAPAFCI